jgi:membrane protein DedA with SNARE-associated domain
MSEIAHLVGSLEPIVRSYGVIVVTIILALESIGFPLPGESLLIFSSILAARGEMSFPALLLCAWIGGVLGDNIGYLIGRMLGRTFILRHGEKIGLNADRFAKVEAVFARYGPVAVGAARFFNVLRQLNGVVAGILMMDWWRFLLFNALGCAVWVLVWGFAGFYLSEHVSKITTLGHSLGLVGAFLVIAGVIVSLVFMFRRPRLGS